MERKIEIRVPDLGDFADVEIIEVLVSAGADVAAEDGLITLETDKATMDVPAPADGRILELKVGVGDTVSSGDVIGTMQVEGENTVVEPQAKETPVEPAAESGDGEPPAGQDVAVTREMTLEVPDLGDFVDVEVIEVHVDAGSKVEVEQGIVTLETDKATMDVPAVAAGTVRSVLVRVGDKVSAGSPLAVIDAEATAGAKPVRQPRSEPPAADKEPAPPAPVPAAARPPSGPEKLPPIDEAGFSKAHASPSVRKLARELGVNLADVQGSGPKSRILHDDVKGYVKAILTGRTVAPSGPSLPAVPAVDFSRFGPTETEPLTRIQKISGPRLQASWINLPHVTQHDLADITDLEARRQSLKGEAREQGISLTPLAFILKACVAALREFPRVNASLSQDGNSLVLKQYCHLGFAADTENGLVVPVIRDADRLSVMEIADQLGKLSAAAREGKLKADQMQGASFTVSSLGGIGGTAFTPIVNAPEVAILGVSRSTVQPVWNGSEFAPRLMLPLSFSYDHRVIDGAYGVRFTTRLCRLLEDVDGLLGTGDSE